MVISLQLRGKSSKEELAGHCIRHPEEIANKLVLWEPLDGTRNRGPQKTTYVDNLLRDSGWTTHLNWDPLWRTDPRQKRL